jgi:hypothetical protein
MVCSRNASIAKRAVLTPSWLAKMTCPACPTRLIEYVVERVAGQVERKGLWCNELRRATASAEVGVEVWLGEENDEPELVVESKAMPCCGEKEACSTGEEGEEEDLEAVSLLRSAAGGEGNHQH